MKKKSKSRAEKLQEELKQEMREQEGYDEDDNFEPCDRCDLPDACADFGCAIKSGVRKPHLEIGNPDNW